jgi:hypothetical protein
MTEAIQELWRTLAHIAPKALLFVCFLAGSWIIATIAGRIVRNLLLRAGFNRLIDRAGLNKMLGRSYGHELAGLLAYSAVLLIGLQLAFGVFGPNPISTLITAVIAYLPRIAVALALIVVAALIASKVRDIIAATIAGLSYANLIAGTAKAFIITLGVIAALNQVGVAVAVTQPVLIAALATIAGILIVGAGGGLIGPAQDRWERILDKAEADSKTVSVTVERTTVE